MNGPGIEKKRIRKLLFLGSVITILIAISPYIFYLYEIFPKTKQWKTLLFTFKVSYYSDLYSTAWYFVNKLIPLYLLFLWLLTCRHWWYFIIHIPITMYVYQVAGLINEDIRYMEQMHFYHILPIVPVLITVTYFLRVKLLTPLMKGIDLKSLSRILPGTKTEAKSLFPDLIIVILIAASPFVFYIYKNIPSTETWRTIFFTLESANYLSVSHRTWFFMNKFVPLYLLFLWILTCRHWWRYIILVPITMYVFQLYSVLNNSIKYVDEMEIYWLIPVILVTTTVVYLLRQKLFFKVVKGIDIEKLDEELKKYKADKN